MSLTDAARYTTMIMAQNPDWCAKRMENFEKYILAAEGNIWALG